MAGAMQEYTFQTGKQQFDILLSFHFAAGRLEIWRLPGNSLEISFYFLPSVHMDMDIHRADGGKGIQDKTNTTTFVFSTCPFRQVKKKKTEKKDSFSFSCVVF